MKIPPLAIQRTALVTSVGLTAASSCAAFRAKLTNPRETRFKDADGGWILAHEVELDQPLRGLPKLARMAAMAISEALEDIPPQEWREIPLIVCVAEAGRPGRLAGLDDRLFAGIEEELQARFHPSSAIVAHGRAGVGVALSHARELIHGQSVPRVVIAATDSLLNAATLRSLTENARLLTPANSNGFMPGEGAGAVLLGSASGADALLITGLGFGVERAHIASDEPLRADGLVAAIRNALLDADAQMHDMDFRITDVSGEQYYFREASLALSRTLRQRKEDFDMWHPAECTGECGALAGIAVLALAESACRKAYTKGPRMLAHFSADTGQRAAVVCQWRGAS
jgi:3-oxoacyl-[acyl-carrier-protein] synthase I